MNQSTGDFKHVGFDPVLWIERLLEVNKGSAFTAQQKAVIETALNQLKTKLRST